MDSKTLVILEHQDGRVEIHVEEFKGDLNSFRDRIKVTLDSGALLKMLKDLGIKDLGIVKTISEANIFIEALLSRETIKGVKYFPF